MKLLIIGHSLEGHIYYKNSHVIKPGGIFYTAMALYNFKESSDEIYLCTSYRKKDSLFAGLYEQLSSDYFNYTDIIPKVRLNVYDNKERDEIYDKITGQLFIKTSDLNKFDGILINMITGFDLTLDQIKEIRNNYNGRIYFDVHTFSRGLNKDMKRVFRQIPKFDEWAKCIDIIQSNSRELYTLAGYKDKYDIIKFILDNGVKYLIETMGKEGVNCYSVKDSGLSVKKIPAIDIIQNNQVGLGDVFGAIFFYSYIKNKDINIALNDAVTAGGCAAGYNDIGAYKNLKDDVFSRHN